MHYAYKQVQDSLTCVIEVDGSRAAISLYAVPQTSVGIKQPGVCLVVSKEHSDPPP